jgi:2-polyprenyl-3-methyl-5-hydroxy-6-metoxy-1,4-benzoquinol methylase
LVQAPNKILKNYLKPGFTVLDIGPGQGYFSLPMAKMVGENGRVVAIDIQKKMLDILQKRAKKAHLDSKINCRLVTDTNYQLNSEVDFALAFWMMHEVPDQKAVLQSIYKSLKNEACFLLAEPYIHVSHKMMLETITTAEQIGFIIIDKPKIFFSKAVLLQKNAKRKV